MTQVRKLIRNMRHMREREEAVQRLIANVKVMLIYINRNGDSMAQFLAKPLAEALAALEGTT